MAWTLSDDYVRQLNEMLRWWRRQPRGDKPPSFQRGDVYQAVAVPNIHLSLNQGAVIAAGTSRQLQFINTISMAGNWVISTGGEWGAGQLIPPRVGLYQVSLTTHVQQLNPGTDQSYQLSAWMQEYGTRYVWNSINVNGLQYINADGKQSQSTTTRICHVRVDSLLHPFSVWCANDGATDIDAMASLIEEPYQGAEYGCSWCWQWMSY